MALFTCRDLSFAYEGNTVVAGLNFSVQRGDYLCVVGENGSGKSTLIKGLLGLKQPQGGEITRGENLKSHEIGYLPQQTAAQKDFPASAYEVVLSGRLGMRGLRPFYSGADKAAAAEIMERLDISLLAGCCYRDLSGGQQQRVLLARALCAAAVGSGSGHGLRALLLDEPVTGLDPIVTYDLYQQLSRVNEEAGLGIVMISHDVRSAVLYASHILHLDGGQAFFGSAADYAASETGARFLGR
ncbi:MAG: metal ABC transporter ATP-binding protein [Clostridiales Family XIII bacterium]|jgi:zinc transport system ATP-binding protein|nr:metal ABC transporter ATP-binding protein [Clostridiales Family XIII bacterium]